MDQLVCDSKTLRGSAVKTEDGNHRFVAQVMGYDNILVERQWRPLKHEEVCLWAYGDGWETETDSCSSRPELTITEAKALQQKASTSSGV